VEGYDKTKNVLQPVEEELRSSLMEKNRPKFKKFRWAQVGAARMILRLTNDRYLKQVPTPDISFIQEWRTKLSKQNSL
jgi:hypothetical protein